MKVYIHTTSSVMKFCKGLEVRATCFVLKESKFHSLVMCIFFLCSHSVLHNLECSVMKDLQQFYP